MPNWPELWLQKHGGNMPGCYVAIDTETSGFSYADQIVSIAHVQVRDGKIEHSMSVDIDWRGVDWVDQSKLRMGLERVAENLSGYNITYDRLCQRGLPALKVFDAYHDIFSKLMQKGYYIVGHNVLRFDETRISKAIQSLRIKDDFNFGNQLIDLQALEIASRQSSEPALKYLPTDTLRTWVKRVINHSGKFGGARLMEDLLPRYNIVLDADRYHDADIGAMASHRVMEHFITTCNNRHDQLHPTQWDVAGERAYTNNVPGMNLPPKPMANQSRTVAVGKRFRGQRTG